MKLLAIAVFAGFVALLAQVGFGQDLMTAKRPVYRVGDSWTYSHRDTRYGKPAARITMSISAVGQNKITVAWQESPGNKHGTLMLNTDLNPLEMHGPGSYVYHAYPFDPVYKFPLKVGEKWTDRFRYTRPDKKYKDTVIETVSAAEKVTVPAGTFNAFKIVVRHDYEGSNGYSNWTGTAKVVRWYAPLVKNYVKKEFFDYGRSNSAPVVDELLKYSLH